MSLEVAEHIPPQFEGKFLSNLDAANSRGLVVSWSSFTDTAHGHVNPKSASAAQSTIAARGYQLDLNLTRFLRSRASFPYMRRAIMVFRRVREVVLVATPATPEPLADTLPPPAAAAVIPLGPTATLAAKVARIKMELGLDDSLLIGPAIQAANAQLGLVPQGTLAEQISMLLRQIGGAAAGAAA